MCGARAQRVRNCKSAVTDFKIAHRSVIDADDQVSLASSWRKLRVAIRKREERKRALVWHEIAHHRHAAEGVLIAVGGPAPIAPGANSVASALGSLARRDPNETVRTYHEGFHAALKIGTFYFAGNKNFLSGSDSGYDRAPCAR